MQIKPGYEIKEVSNRFLVIPIKGSSVNFSAVITVNETGKLLFEKLQSRQTTEQLVKALTDVYDVSDEQALLDVNKFVDTLREHDLLK